MSSHSRKGAPGNDSFVEKLGDRLSSAEGERKVLPLRRSDGPRSRVSSAEQHAVVPPSDAFPPPPSSSPLAVPPDLGPDPSAFEEDESTIADPTKQPKSQPAPPQPPPPLAQSDIHQVPMAIGADDLLDGVVPYVEHPGEADPFAQFEEEIDGESTRIDAQHLLAEQTTHIIEESPDPPYLEVESGKDLGKQFVLNPGETTIGRSIDNDVILTDIAVSRRHVKVILQDDGTLRLHDLGSGNGSQLNGRRVYDSPLSDGDRIELGESVLIVRIPSEMAVLEESGIGLPDRSTTDEEAAPSMPPPATMGVASHPGRAERTSFVADNRGVGAQTDYVALPEWTRGTGVTVPRGWVLAGMIVGGLLVALLGATLTALLLRGGGSGSVEQIVPVAGAPSVLFVEGKRAYEAGRYEAAAAKFAELIEAQPDHPDARGWEQKANEGREHQQALERARGRLEQDDFGAALTQVQSIPETSPVAAAATELRGRIHARQVEELASAGQTALAAGELEDARARLAEARRIDATAAAVQALEVAIREHEEESGTAGRPEAAARRAGSSARREHRAARATQRRETPMRRETRRAEPPTRTEPPARTERPTRRETARGGSGVEDRVLALYRAGNFAGAAQAARQGADAASDSERRVLLGLEGRIRQFATAYQRAEAAGFSATAVRQMQQAVTLDDRISGGHYGRRIKPRLVAAYLGQARSALSRDQIGPGCAAVRSALAIDSSNRDARQLSSTCESRARQIFGRAQGMERSNSREAQNLYRQVQTMLPQGHPLGTQAYQRLNQLARRAGVDEDE